MEEKIDFLLVLKAGRRRFFMSSYKRKDKHKKKLNLNMLGLPAAMKFFKVDF